jgi:hypothetical protein
VSFKPRPLYPGGKSPLYPLDRRLGGPKSWSGLGYYYYYYYYCYYYYYYYYYYVKLIYSGHGNGGVEMKEEVSYTH